jgi:hypothetical protein
MHVPTSDALKKEFMDKNIRDFNITGGGLHNTYERLCMCEPRKHFKEALLLPWLTSSIEGSTSSIDSASLADTSSIDFSLLNFYCLRRGFVLISPLQWRSWLISVFQ